MTVPNADTESWEEANHRALTGELRRIEWQLRCHIAHVTDGDEPESPPEPEEVNIYTALDRLQEVFSLSAFERDVLLLCAGVELDARFPSLCGEAQGEPQRGFPTFSLALATLSGAYWHAFSPVAPLRHYQLIEVVSTSQSSGTPNLTAPLKIDERILFYLLGLDYTDDRLRAILEPVPALQESLIPTRAAIAAHILSTWQLALEQNRPGRLPAIQLFGRGRDGKTEIAAAVCEQARLALYSVSASLIPVDSQHLRTFTTLWEREARLRSAALLVDCEDLDTADTSRRDALLLLRERVPGFLFIATPERIRTRDRAVVTFDVGLPTVEEQDALWHRSLEMSAAGTVLPDLTIRELTAQFHLNSADIASACQSADSAWFAKGGPQRDDADFARHVWSACRVQAQGRLENLELGQRIEANNASWDDLILPEEERQTLRDIAAQVRQRATVYREWGFSRGVDVRGLGITALLCGPSGTGKTTAAEILANELSLELYRIDLSGIVSKYIGETEKNLRQVFDAAEGGGAILLFDEADALFGKRSEVKDSHDRHANIEVSYLLQRMEAYRGLAVLTTNLRSSLDTAFLRRIRFVVTFPFPGVAEREIIWRRAFPSTAPTEGLDYARLAQLIITGGTIRNIALNAAFLAAEENLGITMRHVHRATEREYAKLEKTLTTAETSGWF